MSFGNKLVFAREKKNLTQKKLAELLDITPTRLNYWEKDKREPDVVMIKKIANILDTTGDFLLGLEDYDAKKNNIKRNKLLNSYDKLNTEGQEKAIERIEELTQIPKYQINTEPIDIDSNNIRKFPEKEERVQIIARGKGITTISKDEYDRIMETAEDLDPEDYDKYF